MDYIFTHFSTILEFVRIYIIAKSFSQNSLLPRKQDFAGCILILLPSFLLPDNYPILLWIVGQILYMYYIIHFIKDNLLNGLNLFCVSYGVNILLEFGVYTVSSLFSFSDTRFIPVLGNVLALFITILIFRFTACRQFYSFLIQAAIPYRLLFVNSYFLLVTLLLFYKINSHLFYKNLVYWLVITAILLISNICILYYDRKLFEKRQEIYSYKKNLPIYQSLIEEIRASQHEFSNRIQHFQRLPYVCKDYNSLCQALLKNTSACSKPLHNYPLLQINMPLLAATLYCLSSQAMQQDIFIVFNIGAFELESRASEYQLADFVSILTQNAIEACAENDKIYIRITCVNKRFGFEIRNRVQRHYRMEEINQFFQKKFTTKTEKSQGVSHGYGLYTLLQEVNKLDGIVSAECIEHCGTYWVIFRLEV